MSSNTEAEAHDLHRAQRMEMIFSPITSTPETQSVRIILRGEYESIVKEAEDGNKQVQKYRVATDLSEEAQHALEWAIGTVLGDDNTLSWGILSRIAKATGAIADSGSNGFFIELDFVSRFPLPTMGDVKIPPQSKMGTWGNKIIASLLSHQADREWAYKPDREWTYPTIAFPSERAPREFLIQ